MNRIDCEKCLHSDFDDQDRLRCRLKKCQPEYSDMKETREALLSCFPNSFINDRDEFIAEPRWNQYFILSDCEYPEEVDCKVLEWLSRSASSAVPYATNWRNKRYHKKMQNCINDFLDTNFSEEDFETIYVALGNAINHEKTMKFIKSGYNLEVLDRNLINERKNEYE